MTLSVATSGYHARFVFGDGQRTTGGGQDNATGTTGGAENRAAVSAVTAMSPNLSGTLDRAGLSKGGTAADASSDGGQDAGADQKTAKLQDALSTLLGALGPAATSATSGVGDAIQTILGALAPASGGASVMAGSSAGQGATATTTVKTDTDTADVVRPNLDALNRVLSHYTAQSAATSTVLSLVG